MIDKRFMVTGKRMDNQKTVDGFLFIGIRGWLIGEPMRETSDGKTSGGNWYMVYPDSVEPVAIPVKNEDYGNGGCPNCDMDVSNYGGVDRFEDKFDYCPSCGQRLEWREEL